MPVNKAPEVYGLTSAPGGRHMGFSTVAPASYPTNVAFQVADFVIDPYATSPGMWVCTVAGAGGTATFVRAGSTAQSGASFTALTVQTLTVSSAAAVGATGSSNSITLSGTNTVIGSTAADKVGFFGASPTTRLVSLDSATVESIRILKALGLCST